MGLRAYNHTVSIITKKANDKIYAATIAWMCQVGYEEVIGLMGEQSDTAKSLKVGDKVAVNVCSKQMKALACEIGDTHSNDTNKLTNHEYQDDGSYITFKENKVTLLCEVKDILHLKDIEDDNLVYFKVLSYRVNEDADFLLMGDIR